MVNRDYQEREALLRRMDEILTLSGVESDFMAQAISETRESLVRQRTPRGHRSRSRDRHVPPSPESNGITASTRLHSLGECLDKQNSLPQLESRAPILGTGAERVVLGLALPIC